jgi:hypothetical protein
VQLRCRARRYSRDFHFDFRFRLAPRPRGLQTRRSSPVLIHGVSSAAGGVEKRVSRLACTQRPEISEFNLVKVRVWLGLRDFTLFHSGERQLAIALGRRALSFELLSALALGRGRAVFVDLRFPRRDELAACCSIVRSKLALGNAYKSGYPRYYAPGRPIPELSPSPF